MLSVITSWPANVAFLRNHTMESQQPVVDIVHTKNDFLFSSNFFYYYWWILHM